MRPRDVASGGILDKHRNEAEQDEADGKVDIEDVPPGVLADYPAPEVRAR